MSRLKTICDSTPEELTQGFQYDEVGNFWFKDNGSNILAVAHLDTVQKVNSFGILKLYHETRIYHPKLDDRLGVFIILELLPQLGINVDILLTTDEERGQSTAEAFFPDKEYNWAVEFDRTGDDVVTYQYRNPQFIKALETAEFEIGIGTYTDIAVLDIEASCVNIGVGYKNYHNYDSYFVLHQMLSNLRKFEDFYREYQCQRFAHTSPPVVKQSKLSKEWEYLKFSEDLYCPYCYGVAYDDNLQLRCLDCNTVIPYMDALESDDIDIASERPIRENYRTYNRGSSDGYSRYL